MEERRKISLPHKQPQNTQTVQQGDDRAQGAQELTVPSYSALRTGAAVSGNLTSESGQAQPSGQTETPRTARLVTSAAQRQADRDARPPRTNKVTPTGHTKPEIVRSAELTSPDHDSSDELVKAVSQESRSSGDTLHSPSEENGIEPSPRPTHPWREGATCEGCTGRHPARERWEQRYTRVTWYVENGQLERIRRLSDEGKLRSFTALVNAALHDYLSQHFPL